MSKYINTAIGRLRMIAFLEGLSLLVLVFIAVPLKYFFESPFLVESIGPVHGALFLIFVFYTLFIGGEQQWKFWRRTIAVLMSSVIPFGTFYVDHKILKKLS